MNLYLRTDVLKVDYVLTSAAGVAGPSDSEIRVQVLTGRALSTRSTCVGVGTGRACARTN